MPISLIQLMHCLILDNTINPSVSFLASKEELVLLLLAQMDNYSPQLAQMSQLSSCGILRQGNSYLPLRGTPVQLQTLPSVLMEKFLSVGVEIKQSNSGM